jgi:hypothetical protein
VEVNPAVNKEIITSLIVCLKKKVEVLEQHKEEENKQAEARRYQKRIHGRARNAGEEEEEEEEEQESFLHNSRKDKVLLVICLE